MLQVIDMGFDWVGCHRLGGVLREKCARDEKHGRSGLRDHLGRDEVWGELLLWVGSPQCMQRHCGPGTRLGAGGQEVASPQQPQQRDLEPDAAALVYVRWVDPDLASANRCLLGGASSDFGCVGPPGRVWAH